MADWTMHGAQQLPRHDPQPGPSNHPDYFQAPGNDSIGNISLTSMLTSLAQAPTPNPVLPVSTSDVLHDARMAMQGEDAAPLVVISQPEGGAASTHTVPETNIQVVTQSGPDTTLTEEQKQALDKIVSVSKKSGEIVFKAPKDPE